MTAPPHDCTSTNPGSSRSLAMRSTPYTTSALALALTACAAAFPLTAHAEGDAQAGKAKSWSCLGCHGIPGYVSPYPTFHVPKVGGQHAEYIVAALKAYKAGQRSHATMRAQASALTEQDMLDIAAYFAASEN